ncbi:MAG: glycosyltransferase family 4 protein [Treponema sp.]|nr:glycosyltransferase family 4 protein [Treponema sp.]
MKKNKQKILINGYFFVRNITGIERYAFEITRRLDQLCRPDELAIILPGNFYKKNITMPAYKNIRVILFGKIIPHILWQMLIVQFFLLTHRQYIILDFGNTCLPFTPGIVFLHDIYCELFPEDFTGFRDKIVRLYNRWQYRLIAKRAKKIVTVSNFSKDQIVRFIRANPDKISVIYSSWSHFNNISADYSVYDEFPFLSNPFYFSLGSISKRKNLNWIIGYAGKHLDDLFVISGMKQPTAAAPHLTNPSTPNVIFLGFLDDSKIKALMEKCKAFILPSYYEGFGLTPMEALSCGAKIVISNVSSLPEIYGNSAHYIDPFNTDINLEQLLLEPVGQPENILKKYSYDISSEKVYHLIKEVLGGEY